MPTRRRGSLVSRLHAVALLLATGIWACSTESQNQSPNLLQYLTASAAQSVDASGQFILPQPSASLDSEITREQAEALAQAWVTTGFPALLQGYLETGHGGSIAVDQLRVCDRSFRSESSFAIPDTISAQSIKRGIGPWWLVGLCQGQQIAISLAVSALATDLSIVNGKIVFPIVGSGNEFFPMGVPSSWEGPVPKSPEHAVVEVGTTTGVRITKAPELVSPSPTRGSPQSALWGITLESAVVFRGLSTSQETSLAEVYQGMVVQPGGVAQTPSLAIPTGTQPMSETVHGVSQTWIIPIRIGYPINFEQAVKAGSGS
jgi:hypothetical protein